MISKYITLAAMLAFAAPAFAQGNGAPAATVEAPSSHQELVSYADLDLRDRSGQRALSRRVMRASEGLCIRTEGKFNVDKHLGGKENSCAMRTYRQAQKQIATAIARAERGEQLPAMALVVTR